MPVSCVGVAVVDAPMQSPAAPTLPDGEEGHGIARAALAGKLL